MERVKLKKLLKNIPDLVVRGSKEVEISGMTSHSSLVAPGNLFIAKQGITQNGVKFIPEAVANGAVAILTDLYDPFYPEVVQVLTRSICEVEGLIAQEFYGHPTDSLYMVAITGTNGKTTTSYLIREMMARLDGDYGLIGTVEWIVGSHVFPSTQTTPDLLTNYKLFHEMKGEGCRGCVMEVSSHALSQQRVHSVEFDVAVFTNLTQDHLDYHGSMESYAAAKALLFSSLQNRGDKQYKKMAVINRDSPYRDVMLSRCTVSSFLYGIDTPCDLFATEVMLTHSGTKFTVNAQGKSIPFSSPLIGRHNVYNLLAAISVGLAKGYLIEDVLPAFSEITGIPGRLEKVINQEGLHLFVDYAHTDDALRQVLTALRELKKGRLITVFGCGGNRDFSKRPKMGAVAEELSDVIIITSDNPRHEDPDEIIRQILTGVKDPTQALIIPDRQEAIYRATSMANPDDLVLIAGKGHEKSQVFSHHILPFDDREVAKAALAQRK